jgi:hypothetical protein
MSVFCECCVLSGRGLYDGPITRWEESYWSWCVTVWSRNLRTEVALAHVGLLCQKKISCIIFKLFNQFAKCVMLASTCLREESLMKQNEPQNIINIWPE